MKHHSMKTYGRAEVQIHPDRFTLGERAPDSNWTGGWESLTAGLDVMEKRRVTFPFRELNPGRPARIPSVYRLSYRKISSDLVRQLCDKDLRPI
jgi:hypothetical protein